LGQAALLTADPGAIRSPFFLLAPEFLRLPLTILATCAAIVASQALISGAFSLTAQAVQMAIIPRFRIHHTSAQSIGQVFVPVINGLLALACIILVIGFGTSTALAGAYGVAIALTMVITSMLFFFAARSVWKWKWWKAAGLTTVFLLVDGMFLMANITKIVDGGWLPLVIAAVLLSLMLTWLWGRKRLSEQGDKQSLPTELLIKELERGKIHRVSGMAVFMTGHKARLPGALLHNLKHNQVAHERILLLHVQTLDEPYADATEILEHEILGQGLFRVTLKFGFADTPDVPKALLERLPEGMEFTPGKTTYFLGQETYRVGRGAGWFDRIRLSVFETMARNASPATAHFMLPPSRVVELGAQMTL
ncbi:MAG: KUP/HAK/KT family potassium transporter, partial [Armatimonadetes bacterium]|nr:KUP/HAK/KT family potassium transporter [Akkermansiaceae bacterium]